MWLLCTGPQSALDPAGRGAEDIANLFWWMTAGGAVIWLAFVGLTLYAIRFSDESRSLAQARRLILFGGVVLPTAVLSVLLIYGLATLPVHLAAAPSGSLRIQVIGEQWWWRVRYLPRRGAAFDLANEIHLAVDEPVEFLLQSRDVIHSFWIPALGGKVDMIPGRNTRLSLQPTRTGTFRGVCAEYCGASHAFMAFPVVVHEKAELMVWLAQQAAPSRAPDAALATTGQQHFIAHGCGACHTVRGTAADGAVGPDLTHVGSRLSLAAGLLKNRPGAAHRWIENTDKLKPGALMPRFDMLPESDVHAIAAYLEQLP